MTTHFVRVRIALVFVLVGCGAGLADPDGGPRVDAGSDADRPPSDGGVDAGDAASSPDGFVHMPDGGPLPDGAVPSIEPLRAYCTARGTVLCTAPWSCGCGGERPPPDVDHCVAVDTASCMTELEMALRPLDRVRIDMAAVGRCVQRMEASYAACSATRADLTDWCGAIWVDVAAIGEPCTFADALCGEGKGTCARGTCVALPEGDERCDGLCAAGLTCRGGVCAVPSAEGGACDRDAHCAVDLSCVAGTCRAEHVAVGASCEATPECRVGAECAGSSCRLAPFGEACERDDECPSLGVCGAARGRTCRGPTELGGACRASHECGPSGYCDDLGVCAERSGVGGPCPYGDEQCIAGTVCIGGFSSMCALPGSLGSPCTIGTVPGVDGCADGLSCVGGSCATPPGEGERCADDEECLDGLVCRTASDGARRCASHALDGEPCTSSVRNECASGLYCGTEGVCRPRRVLGEPCEGDFHECAETLSCAIGADRSGTCAAIPAEGEPCTDACSDGLICAETVVGGACVPRVCGELPGGR